MSGGVLVLGATGTIGRAVVVAALEAGQVVDCVQAMPGTGRETLEDFYGRLVRGEVEADLGAHSVFWGWRRRSAVGPTRRERKRRSHVTRSSSVVGGSGG